MATQQKPGDKPVADSGRPVETVTFRSYPYFMHEMEAGRKRFDVRRYYATLPPNVDGDGPVDPRIAAILNRGAA